MSLNQYYYVGGGEEKSMEASILFRVWGCKEHPVPLIITLPFLYKSIWRHIGGLNTKPAQGLGCTWSSLITHKELCTQYAGSCLVTPPYSSCSPKGSRNSNSPLVRPHLRTATVRGNDKKCVGIFTLLQGLGLKP